MQYAKCRINLCMYAVRKISFLYFSLLRMLSKIRRNSKTTCIMPSLRFAISISEIEKDAIMENEARIASF